jgi:hypothetical protein
MEDSLVKRSVSVGLGLIVAVGVGILGLAGCNNHASQNEASKAADAQHAVPSQSQPDNTGKGMVAIQRAADAGKYLFLFCSRNEDEQTRAMRRVFDVAMEKAADRAEWVAIRIGDTAEKAVVSKYSLNRSPMPLVLAIAPNGAITGGFPTKFEEQQLLSAFATPCTEKVMKQLQDGKLVFVCVQNDKTKANDAALQGVHDFKADARFAHATEIVMLDPADSAETSFLTDLKIDPKTEDAMTVFLAPPGAAIAEYKGATDKEELVSTLQKASSSSCPGGACGPGGCK